MNNNDKIKYFIYARKSSEAEDRQINSIEDQLGVLKEMAERDGDIVVDILYESASAKKPGRPVFNQMLERINKGEATGIICWKLNRLARNPVDGGSISWILQNGVVQNIKTPEREYKPADNVLMMQVEFGMSNQFILDLKKDSLRGTLKKAEKGHMPSRAPLGYLNAGDIQGEKYIVEDEERFCLVRKMWDMVLAGETLTRVWKVANEDFGMTTPKRKKSGGGPIGRSTVNAMFSNMFYTGRFKYRDKLYQGNHKPIITMNEFERAQKLLNRKDVERPIKHRFAYTNLIKCGCGCGNAFTAEEKIKKIKSTGEDKRYVYYKSSKRVQGSKCEQKPISEIMLESQITNELVKVRMNQRVLDLVNAIIDEQAETDTKVKQDSKNLKENSIKDKEKEMDSLKHMRMKDFIDDSEFINSKNRLEIDIERLKEQRGSKELILKQSENLKQDFQVMARAMDMILDSGEDLDKKKKIVSSFGFGHTIYNKQLNFNMYSWMEPVRTESENIKDELNRFGPAEDLIKYRKNSTLRTAFPVLGGY